MPRPPFAFFGGTFGCGGGVVCFDGRDVSGVRLGRGAGSGLESRSGSDSDAVASSALDSGGCGEELSVFVFGTGGEFADLASWDLSWGGVACR